MSNPRLTIVETGPNAPTKKALPSRLARQKEQQAYYERLWLTHPDQFNPLRNCMQKERLDRTYKLLTQYCAIQGKEIVDLGCGAGIFSCRLGEAGASVLAVDIAENALKELNKQQHINVEAKQDALPDTTLPDRHYDVVVCMDVIAELRPDDYRLCFAELSRLVKRDGFLICSSPIAINTDGGVQRLADLAQTEFDIIDSVASYHALHMRLHRFFEAPSRYVSGWKDPQEKNEELNRCHGFSRWWYFINTSPFMIWIWFLLSPIVKPILSAFKNSRKLLLGLEKVCRFISDENGISHYLFIAKLRPLQEINPREIPVERLQKKQVWE